MIKEALETGNNAAVARRCELNPNSERVEIAHKYVKTGYKVKLVLSIVGLSKSTYYYHINNKGKKKNHNGGCSIPGYSLSQDGKKISDDRIKKWLMQFIENEGAYYGYWKLTIDLKKYLKLIINKNKVYRLCKELSIPRPQRKIKPKHPRKIARNHTHRGSMSMANWYLQQYCELIRI